VADVAVSAHGLSKRYRVGQVETAVARASRRMRRQKKQTIWAVDDLTFEIKEGDATAVIGRNGAGKSTLLKLLSRITEPTKGYADIYGRVASLLEVGTGFSPELTGRENVYLNGAILGMNKAEVRRKFDQIVEFSGVGQHIDTPVKWYSSGMYVRLAFAVAAHLEPEILIVDEVLAVGDAEFQKRCLGRMSEVASEGRTVLFVSHNMQAIRRLCRSGMLLEKGKLVAEGDGESVIRGYLASVGRTDEGRRTWADDHLLGDEMCQVREVNISDHAGVPGAAFFSSKPITITLEFDLAATNPSFTAGFDLATIDGVVVFRSYLTDGGDDAGMQLKPGRNAIRCTIPAGLLNSGRYLVNLRIGLHWIKWIVYSDDVLQFDVIADHGESLFLNDQARPGVVAPILQWDVVEASSDGSGVDIAEAARSVRAQPSQHVAS
jgi:homopolymeric O-antigen transport system ATP-binding protein